MKKPGIKVDIKEELNSRRRKTIAESESSKEIKLLMDNSSVEERNILKEAGLDSNIKKAEEVMGVNIVREKQEEKMNEEVFTEAEVKDICIKYNLRFLPSRMYKGYIEPTLGSDLLNFFKNKVASGTPEYEAKNNLYIMAPYKAFNLEERPAPPKNVDPAIFYKISTSEGSMYVLIRKWGKDFTVARRINALFKESRVHWFGFKSVVSFFAISTIFVMFGINPFFWATVLISSVLALVVSALHTQACISIIQSDRNNRWSEAVSIYNERFSTDGWKSTFKRY